MLAWAPTVGAYSAGAYSVGAYSVGDYSMGEYSVGGYRLDCQFRLCQKQYTEPLQTSCSGNSLILF